MNSHQTISKNKFDFIVFPGLTYFITGIFLVITGYSVIKSIHWPIDNDVIVMHYIAQRMLAGAMPYRDIFDINLPGGYFFSLFVIHFLGAGTLAWRVFDLAWLFATACVAGIFCYPFSKWAAVLAFIFVIAYHIIGGFIDAGQRDFLMVLLLLGASFFFTRYLEKRSVLYPLFLTGFCLGFSSMLKHTPPLLAILFSIVVIWINFHNKKNILKSLGLLLGGFAIIPTIFLIWLLSNHAFNDFIQIMVQYNLQIYSHLYNLSNSDLFSSLFNSDNQYWIIAGFFVPMAVFYDEKLRQNPRFWVAMAGMIFGLLHFFIQSKGWRYQSYPFSIFLLLIIAIILSEFITKSRPLRVFSFACFILIVSLLSTNLIERSRTDITPNNLSPMVSNMILDIKSFHLIKTDTVQVMGGVEGGLQALYILDIKQPTRFIYDVPLLYSPEQTIVKNLRSEFIRGLTANKPKVIIIAKTEYKQPVNGIGRFNNFPEFLDVLKTYYHPGPSRGQYDVYDLTQH